MVSRDEIGVAQLSAPYPTYECENRYQTAPASFDLPCASASADLPALRGLADA